MLFANAVSQRVFLVPAVLVLTACSGSSGGSSDAAADGSTPPPTVSISASPSSIAAGDSVVLNWSTTNADGCQASGGWSGSKSVSGSETVGPIQQNTVFTLSCSGTGGGTVQSVEVRIPGNDVNVQLSASAEYVLLGGSSTLNWSASNADSCTASGAWSGSRPTSGSETVGPLNADATYQLSCSGSSGSAVSMITVYAVDKTLRWQAPTENVDGTALTDLAGFVVYWGPSSRNYTGSFTINSATTTEWEVTVGSGEYYFAMTAFDSQSNESAYSNEVVKIIP